MHERMMGTARSKETAIQVILYEREMLEHCAKTFDSKKERWEATRSEEARSEYNLVIECFLLHFRNLLGFFINKRMADTDLTIDRPQQWADGRAVNEALLRELTRLTGLAKNVNTKHGLKDPGLSEEVDCYKKISWFLQHCTEHRYLLHGDWEIGTMFADICPILVDFLRHLGAAPTKPRVTFVGSKGHSTAS